MKIFLSIIMLFSAITIFGQYSDNFTDGDFTSDPTWIGETEKFTISVDNELQLYDETESGTAYLSTYSSTVNNATWEFIAKFDFNPSSSNYANFYLTSDNPNLNNPLNGYFIKVGNTDDDICLYKQEGNTKTKIIDGTDGRLNTSSVLVHIRVTRDDLGNWELLSDTLGGSNYYTEGSVFDDTNILSYYSGISCTYTSTRFDKMFFDDFVVTGNPFLDTVKPEILSYEIINDTAIQLNFTEPMEETTTLETTNYQINNSIGNPASVTFAEGNNSKVVLKLTNQIQTNQPYTLSYQSMKDLSGNTIISGNIDFEIVDVTKPEILSYEIINDTAIQLNFTEPMDETTTLETTNYQINNNIDNPASVTFENGDNSKVFLSLSDHIQTNQNYILLYQYLEDLSGNTIVSGSIDFAIVDVTENDIVFNEIMADPTPIVGLPEEEYLEIYNRKDLPINLANWSLVIGTNSQTFPAVTIPANSFLIICANDNISLFESNGETAGFESFSLLNNGTTIKLLDSNSNLITETSYTKDWYQDPNKDDGGWSIERIDPNNHCSGISNWGASNSSMGGTPGQENSIFGENIDSISPEIESWEISSANEITITFSEMPDTSTVLNYSNFSLSPDYGEPLLISQNEDNTRSFHLQFISAFQEDIYYTLSISNISDNCGNIMEDTEISFINYIAESFDVLITEIFADPSPQVFLPEAEYIELYNQAIYPINLSGWELISGSTSTILPAIEIPVGGYICLTDLENISDFQEIENVNGVDGFPSLSNSYGELQLISKEGKDIHFVNYSEDWFESSTKKEGGWSLEMIDLNNPCASGNNWAESESSTGGTPGAVNSVIDNNPDIYIPEIQRAIVQNSDSLLIWFNEIIHPDFVPDNTKFTVNQNIGNPISVTNSEEDKSCFVLVFEEEFIEHTLYELTISDTVVDCVGNKLSESVSIEFAVADSVEANDVVINEILFNPLDGASDYVELYNRSDKFIDLGDLRIATRDDSLIVDNVKILTESGFLLFPETYVVISDNISSVETNYYCKNANQLLEIESLPTYANEEGDVVLCIRNLEIIDEVLYNEDMQFKLLNSFDGVSLERINYDKPSGENSNWHSAAESVNFGTPTYKNSQYQDSEEGTSLFSLSPESISPDNDGYNDFLNIRYNMDKPGYVISISIFDASGHYVRNLTENELLGTEGNIVWDGLNDDNQQPGTGIYIVLLDYFDLEGNRHQEKKTCVLSVKY